MDIEVGQNVTVKEGFGEKFPALKKFVGAKGKVAKDDKTGEVLKGLSGDTIGVNVSDGGRVFVNPEDLE